MPNLAPVEPLMVSALAAGVAMLPRLRRHTITSALWVLWAGIAGGAVAAAALSAEFLNAGTGGLALSGLGGLAGAALMTVALVGVGGAAMWRDPDRSTKTARTRSPLARPASSGSRQIARPSLLAWSLAAVAAVGAVLLAAVGLGWLGVLGLLALSAVATTRFGWSLSAGFFVMVGIVSALYVVAAQLVLSPFDAVGRSVPATVVVAVVAMPLMTVAFSPDAWRSLLRVIGLTDAAAVGLALICGLSWWHLFHRLTASEFVAQIVRLGEDNLSHMLMLHAARRTGDTLGSSDASRVIADRFTGYFPGSSSWQAAVGDLVGAGSTKDAYLVSSAVLLGLLAGLAGSVAGRVRSRPGGLAALGIFAIGAVASRATLAMYELGFPGQLLVACWVLTALHLCLQRRRHLPPMMLAPLLALLVLASWWCWNLAAVVLALPLLITVGVLLGHLPVLTVRRQQLLIATGVAIVLLGVLVERHRVVAILDELVLEGAVFRGIPVWLALALVLALPLALQIRGRPVPLTATVLVLGFGAAMLVLSTWQVARAGTMTYYGYKLEYFLLAAGWAAGSLAVVGVGDRIEATTRLPAKALAVVPVLVLAWPLASWPAANYRDWLAARSVLGPDPNVACAVQVARHVPSNSIALAVGFGDPVVNYITTRSMDVGLGSSASATFWPAVLNQPDPATWPWATTSKKIVVVSGPAATRGQVDQVVSAATAAGAHAEDVSTCAG